MGSLMSLLPFILVFVFFWIFLIVPQRKQQKQREAMLKNLKKGDKVITAGGIHGEIIDFDDEDVKIKISEKVEIRLLKSAISRVES
ncbi:MAG: preprotein translocase subunit YajC [Firmicutes bacterium]|nr:preprotein translocase subunit YajC [Bacillota bacterium]